MLRNRLLSLTLAVLCAASAASARRPGDPFHPGFNLFSRQQDIQLGQESAAQVRKQYQVVQNQFLQDYLKRVGERLATTKEAKESGFNFTFTLLNEPSINAFALPGGPMFVFTGLMKAVDNEAQLTGVMAHEMSHVILRHGTNQMSKANFLQLPALLAGAAVGNGSLIGQLAQAGMGLGLSSMLLKFSRSDESQADLLGSHLMAETGYNPIEMARFFEKLEADGGSRGPQFFSDHPNPGNRMKAIEEEIQGLPQRTYGYQTGEFVEAKTQVARIAPPPKTQQAAGARENLAPPSQAPSSSWRQLRGQAYNVSYPGNWTAFGDSSSAAVTIAPREGLVQGAGGRTSVGYGAILSYFFPDGARSSLAAETDDLIHHLRAANAGMRQASPSQRHIKVSDNDALVSMLASDSPYGGAETDALVTVSRPEGLFYMVFIAPQKNFEQLRPTFEQMLGSIRFQ